MFACVVVGGSSSRPMICSYTSVLVSFGCVSGCVLVSMCIGVNVSCVGGSELFCVCVLLLSLLLSLSSSLFIFVCVSMFCMTVSAVRSTRVCCGVMYSGMFFSFSCVSVGEVCGDEEEVGEEGVAVVVVDEGEEEEVEAGMAVEVFVVSLFVYCDLNLCKVSSVCCIDVGVKRCRRSGGGGGRVWGAVGGGEDVRGEREGEGGEDM